MIRFVDQSSSVFCIDRFSILCYVFQHNCHLLKLECQPLNWARLGIIADRECFLHQSSCFGLRQSPVVSAVNLSLVSCSCHYHTLQVCFFHFGDLQEIPKLIRKVRSLLSLSTSPNVKSFKPFSQYLAQLEWSAVMLQLCLQQQSESDAVEENI